MLGKRPTVPMIGKLSELLVSGGGRAVAFLDTAGTPRGPLDMKAHQSPRGLKAYDLGGVGLGIVVALEKGGKSTEKRGGSEVLPKHAVCCVPNLKTLSGPIPVRRNPEGFRRDAPPRVNEIDDAGSSSEEDYTYVTCHVANKTFTKVYYDGGEGQIWKQVHNNKNDVVPVRTLKLELPEPSFPCSNFLSSCHLCRKELHGKDIYMYRGEKAFCSPECRSRQMMTDERKERCRSEASRTQVELSTSPYTREQIFSTGILAL